MNRVDQKTTAPNQVRSKVKNGIKLLTLATSAVALNVQAQAALEEVVVTAQKRVESLSDVPISVNVVDGTMITDSGITNLSDLSDFVPNLSMNQTGIGTNVTIRGISSGINPAFEQSVGMYVDDVYYGRAVLARAPYLDIARVEVLRGPQPILFGKNAIAGAISMITEKASTQGTEGFLQAEYNFDQDAYDFSGAVNFAIGDSFGVRLSGLKRDSDGYYENTSLDRDESQLDEEVLRASLRWEPTDNLTADLKLERSTFDSKGRYLELINPVEVGGSPTFAEAVFASTGGQVELDTKQDFKRQSNGDIEEIEVDNATLKFDWQIGDLTLTSITARVEYEDYLQCDCDFASFIALDTSGEEEFEQTSQEFRLASAGGETFDWIVGAFYQEYDVTVDDLTILPVGGVLAGLSPVYNGSAARRAYATDSELWSAFAQVTWNISDDWRFTLGGRYSDETKSGSRSIEIVDNVTDPSPVRDIAGQEVTTNPAAGPTWALGLAIDNEQFNASGLTDCGGPEDAVGHDLSCDREESKFTPAANLQWDATEDTMVYASYTEGFKAGGFDARANNTGSFEFEEELATSYEVGTKMTLADGRAEVNIALYRTEYDDLQTSQFDGTVGFNVTNAGEATTQGLELDGRWQATDALLVSFSAGYLDFEFDSFPNSQCYFGETPDYPEGSPLAGLCDRGGDTREFTPELTANLGGQYFVPIGSSMEMTLGLDLIYSDDYFVSPTLDPNLTQDSYTKLNGRIALASDEGSWQVALLLENITDEEVNNFGNQAPLSTTISGAYNRAIGAPGVATAYYGFYTAPFNVALQARYNF
ncbi:MAG: TonB-dependent receptor [Halioglobus sp.]